jgi:hypothetical protein
MDRIQGERPPALLRIVSLREIPSIIDDFVSDAQPGKFHGFLNKSTEKETV